MMTEQEQEALEQAAKPQRWGSRERVALVAEVLRQKRMVWHLCEKLADFYGTPSEKATPEYWLQQAEQAVAEELSPKG